MAVQAAGQVVGTAGFECISDKRTALTPPRIRQGRVATAIAAAAASSSALPIPEFQRLPASGTKPRRKSTPSRADSRRRSERIPENLWRASQEEPVDGAGVGVDGMAGVRRHRRLPWRFWSCAVRGVSQVLWAGWGGRRPAGGALAPHRLRVAEEGRAYRR